MYALNQITPDQLMKNQEGRGHLRDCAPRPAYPPYERVAGPSAPSPSRRGQCRLFHYHRRRCRSRGGAVRRPARPPREAVGAVGSKPREEAQHGVSNRADRHQRPPQVLVGTRAGASRRRGGGADSARRACGQGAGRVAARKADGERCGPWAAHAAGGRRGSGPSPARPQARSATALQSCRRTRKRGSAPPAASRAARRPRPGS